MSIPKLVPYIVFTCSHTGKMWSLTSLVLITCSDTSHSIIVLVVNKSNIFHWNFMFVQSANLTFIGTLL